jgi:hypothetical protein
MLVPIRQCFGWRQSIVATLKANTFGIRFEFCAARAQIGRYAVDLHTHGFPVYTVIYHSICLFQCQNLAACAATDFDAQNQIPLRCIWFLRGTRPRKNDLLTQINLNRFSRPLRGNRKA